MYLRLLVSLCICLYMYLPMCIYQSSDVKLDRFRRSTLNITRTEYTKFLIGERRLLSFQQKCSLSLGKIHKKFLFLSSLIPTRTLSSLSHNSLPVSNLPSVSLFLYRFRSLPIKSMQSTLSSYAVIFHDKCPKILSSYRSIL